MCLLCIEIAKGVMTPREIAGAIGEIRDTEHVEKIWDKLEETNQDQDVRSEFDKLIKKAVSNIYRE